MNRREFLHPGHIAQTAGSIVAAAQELGTLGQAAAQDDIALIRFGRRAMATTFEVLLPYGTPEALGVAGTALDEIDRLEAQLSVYRESSEVSRLNRLAFEHAVQVESRLFELLELAARITTETEGAFDVTAGALIKVWGFYRGPRRVPEAAELGAALNRAGMRHLRLDPDTRTVRYLCSGLEINLGSIGKGYSLDRTADLLRQEWDLTAGLLHGGQSSVYAIGTAPGDRRGWPVGIRHPWNPEQRLAMVRLRDQALGTSAATFQHLEYNGRKLGHILDPRRGWPAEGTASASVVAPTAAEADALATAFFVLGVDKARHYCERHPGIGAILLPEAKGAEPVVLGLSLQEASVLDV